MDICIFSKMFDYLIITSRCFAFQLVFIVNVKVKVKFSKFPAKIVHRLTICTCSILEYIFYLFFLLCIVSTITFSPVEWYLYLNDELSAELKFIEMHSYASYVLVGKIDCLLTHTHILRLFRTFVHGTIGLIEAPSRLNERTYNADA